MVVRHSRWICLAVLLLGVLAASAGGKKMTVIVEEAKVFASSAAFAKVVGTVKNGGSVLMLEEKGSWIRVSVPDQKIEGWMYRSSVQSRLGRLFSSDDKVAENTSSAEAARAGRGFDEQVEAAYRKKNPNVDFSWINKTENDPPFKVTPEQQREFVAAGKLEVQAGGGK